MLSDFLEKDFYFNGGRMPNMKELFVSIESYLRFCKDYGFKVGEELIVSERGFSVEKIMVIEHDIRDHGYQPLIKSGIVPKEYIWDGEMLKPDIEGEYIAAYVTFASIYCGILRGCKNLMSKREAEDIVKGIGREVYRNFLKDFKREEEGVKEELEKIGEEVLLYLFNSEENFRESDKYVKELKRKVEIISNKFLTF